MVACDSNQRCEACPIERLEEPSDRTKAGFAVRLILRQCRGDKGLQKPLGPIAREKIEFLKANDTLVPYIVGATAINLADECQSA